MRIIILSFVVIGFLSACTTSRPLTNVEAHNIQDLLDSDETINDVKVNIIRAGQLLGWEMEDVKPRMIQGTLKLRAHTAVVNIPYSLNSYSIQYVTSINLDYDGEKIHRNYLRWVNNLKVKIDEFIAAR